MSKWNIDETVSKMDVPFDNDNLSRIKQQFKRKRRWIYYRRAGILVASLLIAISGSLNINLAFAEQLSNIPVIGQVVRVLTFNRLEVKEDNLDIDIEIPRLQGLEDGELQDAINDILASRSMVIYDKAMEEADIQKETGFISSLPVNVSQSYRLLVQTDDYISFQVITFTVGASGYETSYIYNINLKDNRMMSLKDVYADYELLNEMIISETNRRNELGEGFFVDHFEGVHDEQNFYVKDGKLIIVFNEYEVAAGYMGMPEIEIDLRPIE